MLLQVSRSDSSFRIAIASSRSRYRSQRYKTRKIGQRYVYTFALSRLYTDQSVSSPKRILVVTDLDDIDFFHHRRQQPSSFQTQTSFYVQSCIPCRIGPRLKQFTLVLETTIFLD